ncbi:MAG: hypothetical protein GY820_30670, partial [Gammaproteobacteria bacterium]|nr:hypothetical protein [Gammaproteobacteria bacterium]
VRYFHTYIMGCEVVLITDHNSLTFLMKQPNPIPRLQRWILSLDQYRITWMYRKGMANLVADALSRRYQSAEESERAQSDLIKLDAVICRTGGHFRLTELKCMIAAMVTRSQSRVAKDNISVSPPKIVPKVHSEKINDNPKLEGDRAEMDRTNDQLREAQLKDLELKTIIDLLEHSPQTKRVKGLIGYRMEDNVLYYADDNGENRRIVV